MVKDRTILNIFKMRKINAYRVITVGKIVLSLQCDYKISTLVLTFNNKEL